jgi:hypothetical protein
MEKLQIGKAGIEFVHERAQGWREYLEAKKIKVVKCPMWDVSLHVRGDTVACAHTYEYGIRSTYIVYDSGLEDVIEELCRVLNMDWINMYNKL